MSNVKTLVRRINARYVNYDLSSIQDYLPQTAEEMEAAVKAVAAKVIESPIAYFKKGEWRCWNYHKALDALLKSAPAMTSLGGKDDMERLDLVYRWMDSCFPAGTVDEMYQSLLLEDEIRLRAIHFEKTGAPEYAKFKTWYKALVIRNTLGDVYYYYCDFPDDIAEAA